MSTASEITLQEEEAALPELPVITIVSWKEDESTGTLPGGTDRAQSHRFITTWQFTYKKPGSSPNRKGAYRIFQALWNAEERKRLTYFPSTQLVSVGAKETVVALRGYYRAGNAVEARVVPNTEHSETTGGGGPFGPEGKWFFTTIVEVVSREISSLDRADFDRELQQSGDSKKLVIAAIGG